MPSSASFFESNHLTTFNQQNRRMDDGVRAPNPVSRIDLALAPGYARRPFDLPDLASNRVIGCVCSTPPPSLSPTHQELFVECKEAEFLSTTEECADKVRFYLKAESERDRIAEQGYCIRPDYSLPSSLAKAVAQIQSLQE